MFSSRRFSKKIAPYLIGIGTLSIIAMMYNDGLFKPVYSEENEIPWTKGEVCLVEEETYYNDNGLISYDELFEEGKEYDKDGAEISLSEIPIPFVPDNKEFSPGIEGSVPTMTPESIGPGFVPNIIFGPGYWKNKSGCIRKSQSVYEPETWSLIIIGLLGLIFIKRG